ncbi:MAG TPA: Vms1/Ankzf1 family peptidyl-tRNA hydrolase [Vicinamibacterales bacterium]|nr:Vms1/Ankzf1 family peptidyl-tRNA hydrolase [Vicinamibacterales bacterium]
MNDRTAPATPLTDVLDRLARFEPTDLPVISLYLNLQADERGKDNFASFVRKELKARGSTYPADSPSRASFDRDTRRIEEYLGSRVSPSFNGLALFACAGAHEFFEAVPLDAPLPSHRLSVGRQPHLYPLELIADQYPVHAAVMADSQAARIFVFGLNRTLRSETVGGERIKRVAAGGWSQMRYQRHVEKLQADHVRELVSVLDRVVRQDKIDHVVLIGDAVNVALVKGELSKELSAKLVDELKLEAHASPHEVMKAAADAMRAHDARTDAEVIRSVLDEYRAGGLATAGPEPTRAALERGQVDELYLTAQRTDDTPDSGWDELVGLARQTSASVRFIEDSALLADVGGIAAALRY